MKREETPRLFEFDSAADSSATETPAAPRPANFPRKAPEDLSVYDSKVIFFDCEPIALPTHTKAEPRPLGRERQTFCDEDHVNGTPSREGSSSQRECHVRDTQ